MIGRQLGKIEEDAGKEDATRLTSYYYKTLQYEEVISDIKLQIITGEKGTGKSALLKMAYIESSNTDVVSIWIRNYEGACEENLCHILTNILASCFGDIFTGAA